jgi:ribosomal-protein-alanine N-acetyltransferase
VNVVETPRLVLRRLHDGDAPFILELVNEPSWLRYIGDRNVHSIEDAEGYIAKGPADSYEKNGFGLYLVEVKPDGSPDGGAPAGMCGLIRRDTLPHVDIGFAFSPRFWGRGYAYEAAAGVMDYARGTLGLDPILAIVDPDNKRSISLLRKLGMRFERKMRMPNEESDVDVFTSAG